MQAIIHGIILAFGLILPLGVQNVFVFSQGAMQPSKFKALPAVFTAALCDTLLILLAVLGLSVIVYQFEWLRLGLISGGILFLIYMGRVLWTAKAEATQQGGGTASKKTNIVCPIRFIIKSTCYFRYSWRYWNERTKLYWHRKNAFHYNMYYRLMAMVYCFNVRWLNAKKVDASGKVMYIFNKCSAVFIWGTAVYLLIGLF